MRPHRLAVFLVALGATPWLLARLFDVSLAAACAACGLALALIASAGAVVWLAILAVREERR